MKYCRQNLDFSFESQLDRYLNENEIDLPNEFVYINNSSNATEWIIFFQNEFGYNVKVEKRKYKSKGFNNHDGFENEIVMICKK